MELPANPADLVYGVYNKKGENIIEEQITDEKQRSYWALNTEEEATEYCPVEEAPFDMVDYNMW